MGWEKIFRCVSITKRLCRREDIRLQQNWYDGEYKVLDEEVIDTIHYESKEVSLITENSYKAVILNTDSMLIIDIDINGGGDTPIGTVIAQYEEQAIHALKVLSERQELNFRVYRTAGGLRAIETTKRWNPTGWDTGRLMKSVYADPLYVALCRNQETFRARLTPKPWRLWDYDDYGFSDGKKWMNNKDISNTAVCELIRILGDNHVDDSFKSIISYHDNVTKALISKDKDLALV